MSIAKGKYVSQLTHIRQKIKTIQTTKKITHAVRLVSMSMYGKLDKQGQQFTTYVDTVEKAFLQLTSPLMETWKHPILFPEDSLDATPLFIISATNKGLCGSLNSNMFRYLSIIVTVAQHQRPSFIAIGNRARKYIEENNLGPIIASYNNLKTESLSDISDDLLEKIFTAPEPFSSVTFYGNRSKSFFAQVPYHTTFLPLKPTLPSEEAETATMCDQDDIIWEQDKDLILEQLAKQYLESKIVYALYHALKSEHAARFLAMENSTNNAEKCLEKLIQLFNKTRQTLITREVAELGTASSEMLAQ